MGSHGLTRTPPGHLALCVVGALPNAQGFGQDATASSPSNPGVSVTSTCSTTALSASTSTEERLGFAEYVAQRRPALLRAARAICGDASSAEDLLQAALARVLPHWSAIREPGAADAYTRRTMRNQHISWCRQGSHRRERSFAEVPDLDPSWDRYPGTDAALWTLVAALPPAQRAAVALRYYEGLSVSEVSKALGCSPATVKSNASRGVASLRRSIVDSGRDIDLIG
jgi:RNA polymerase sigma-70 factor (sigma-E family)